MRRLLEAYKEAGVHNVMALGGDLPDDPALVASDFAFALDLVELVRDVGGFSLGVAAHPAGHPRSPSLTSDRDHLARKLALADFAVTQFFFETSEWTQLVNDLADRGVSKPVLPGIMPVTTVSGIERMASMGGRVPEGLADTIRAAYDRGGAAAARQAGIDAAVALCRDLLAAGAPGLHFYTLNRSTATREIHQQLFPS
jgi:methylenetetrahydrofolate reductase (NADPH)